MPDLKKVDEILKKHGNDVGQLIGILQDVQGEFNYLPKHPLEHVAQKLGIPEAQVYGVATFFKAFSLKPRGKHIVHVCMGTACHVRGAKKILEECERDLQVAAGGTTKDMKFTLETVNCLGACALGPIVVVDGEYHGRITVEGTKKALKKVAE
ncbi:MAG: NAD(P)H-dependent oxidoreductase subunit E [Deltaproteobacteria bacterium CG11_big_fil_rev_8_21_14_0_20_49_13]|nr:MAG: NAD(P)H-dependent oxidoreductase subunit E [Deltaproteobacteria bacterium CG11_big_fil_rev_8_21_14_0_20_49_13]